MYIGDLLLFAIPGAYHTSVVLALTSLYVKSLHDIPRAGVGVGGGCGRYSHTNMIL